MSVHQLLPRDVLRLILFDIFKSAESNGSDRQSNVVGFTLIFKHKQFMIQYFNLRKFFRKRRYNLFTPIDLIFIWRNSPE